MLHFINRECVTFFVKLLLCHWQSELVSVALIKVWATAAVFVLYSFALHLKWDLYLSMSIIIAFMSRNVEINKTAEAEKAFCIL